jgi:hypothetical protein
MEVSQASSLPAGIPRRLARRPHLAATLLRWRNAYHFRRVRILSVTALALALVVGLLASAPTSRLLEWLAGNPVITFAISAGLFGLAAVRRQARMQADAATSWLAALPATRSTFTRLALGSAAQLLAFALFVEIAGVTGRISASAASGLVLVTAIGAVIGTLAGLRLLGRAAATSPRWHYASVRRARRHWATAPSLAPLSYWPLARGRFFGRPKMTSRVVLLTLLSIPAGLHDVPGQVAIAVAAGCITLVTLLSLSAAVVAIAGEAARWLAPTTIRSWTFVSAFAWRVALKQAAVLAVLLILAGAVDYGQALHVGVKVAAAFLAASCLCSAAACIWACRQAGLGAAGRGA